MLLQLISNTDCVGAITLNFPNLNLNIWSLFVATGSYFITLYYHCFFPGDWGSIHGLIDSTGEALFDPSNPFSAMPTLVGHLIDLQVHLPSINLPPQVIIHMTMSIQTAISNLHNLVTYNSELSSFIAAIDALGGELSDVERYELILAGINESPNLIGIPPFVTTMPIPQDSSFLEEYLSAMADAESFARFLSEVICINALRT